jgi:hypothetical protein
VHGYLDCAKWCGSIQTHTNTIQANPFSLLNRGSIEQFVLAACPGSTIELTDSGAVKHGPTQGISLS